MTLTFIVAFVVSFLGSIPPGAINLSVLQLSAEGRADAALRFALAGMLVEIPYAYIAIRFQALLEQSPWLTDNFKLIAAVVLVTLGITSLLSKKRNRAQGFMKKFHESGFRKGILVGILNPMAILFWIALTSYLVQHDWVDLGTTSREVAYIAGLAAGTIVFLLILIVAGKRLTPYFRENAVLQKLPGIAFILLGIYSLASYFHLF